MPLAVEECVMCKRHPQFHSVCQTASVVTLPTRTLLFANALCFPSNVMTRSQDVAMRHDFAGLLQPAFALDNAVEI